MNESYLYADISKKLSIEGIMPQTWQKWAKRWLGMDSQEDTKEKFIIFDLNVERKFLYIKIYFKNLKLNWVFLKFPFRKDFKSRVSDSHIKIPKKAIQFPPKNNKIYAPLKSSTSFSLDNPHFNRIWHRVTTYGVPNTNLYSFSLYFVNWARRWLIPNPIHLYINRERVSYIYIMTV